MRSNRANQGSYSYIPRMRAGLPQGHHGMRRGASPRTSAVASRRGSGTGRTARRRGTCCEENTTTCSTGREPSAKIAQRIVALEDIIAESPRRVCAPPRPPFPVDLPHWPPATPARDLVAVRGRGRDGRSSASILGAVPRTRAAPATLGSDSRTHAGCGRGEGLRPPPLLHGGRASSTISIIICIAALDPVRVPARHVVVVRLCHLLRDEAFMSSQQAGTWAKPTQEGRPKSPTGRSRAGFPCRTFVRR